jgi:hypothetical protein
LGTSWCVKVLGFVSLLQSSGALMIAANSIDERHETPGTVNKRVNSASMGGSCRWHFLFLQFSPHFFLPHTPHQLLRVNHQWQFHDANDHFVWEMIIVYFFSWLAQTSTPRIP